MELKYQIVFAEVSKKYTKDRENLNRRINPLKYQRKKMYWKLKREAEVKSRELWVRKDIEIIEAQAWKDYIYMLPDSL